MMRRRPNRNLWAIAVMAMTFALTPLAHAQSEADCAARADRAARDSGGTMGGAVRGAAGGALIGAIIGNSKSTKRGAALGAIIGGARSANRKNNVYKRVYDDCMAHRYR